MVTSFYQFLLGEELQLALVFFFFLLLLKLELLLLALVVAAAGEDYILAGNDKLLLVFEHELARLEWRLRERLVEARGGRLP